MPLTAQNVTTAYEGTKIVIQFTTDRDLSTADEVVHRVSRDAAKKGAVLEKKKNATLSEITLDTNGTGPANNRATVTYTAAETRVKAATYYHELRVRESDDVDEEVLALGDFILNPSNTSGD